MEWLCDSVGQVQFGTVSSKINKRSVMPKKAKRVVLKGRAKEFEALFQKSGWSQTEAGHRLKLSSSNYVYMILHGRSQPSAIILEPFRMKIACASFSSLLQTVSQVSRINPKVHGQVTTVLDGVAALIELLLLRSK